MRSLSESKLKKLSNNSMFILVRTLSLHDPNSNYSRLKQVRKLSNSEIVTHINGRVKLSNDDKKLVKAINDL